MPKHPVEIDRGKPEYGRPQEVYCYWFECPSCGSRDIQEHSFFCPGCGRKIVWIGKSVSDGIGHT